MKTNWQTKKLGEIKSIVFMRGNGLRKSLIRENGKFSCILYGELYTKYKHPIIKKIFTKTNFDGKIKSVNGDVLVPGTTTADAYGIAIARSINKGGIILGGDINILRTQNKDIISDYLSYFLNGPAKLELASYANGTNIMHLSNKNIRKIQIPLPSLPEQRRIVKVLDEVFEKTAKAKENAEGNLKNAKELFESYLNNIFANQGKDWEEKRLGDKSLLQIIDGDRGKNYPKKSDFSQKEYCLFLNTKNVRPNGFDFKTTMFITKKKDNELGNGKLQRNDVLLTTRGTIGNIAVYDKDVSFKNIRINSGMLIFRPNTKLIIPEYLFTIFQSGIMKAQIKKYVSGAAQPQLPIKTLVSFLIPVPKSISKQKSIVKKLDALSAETKKLEGVYKQKLLDLEELKKSVLKKAFEGKL